MRDHAPVLFDEVMAALDPQPGGTYVDGTINGGGHAAGLLQRSSPDGRLLGIDLDLAALEVARESLADYGSRLRLVHGSYGQLAAIASHEGFYLADGVVLDLGLSMMQLSAARRGFSFQLEGPLDMRFDSSEGMTAAELVNSLPEGELADLLYQYGEERRSRRIARAIVRARPLSTTTELAGVVAKALGRRGRIHPATRTFQALRIAVNDELNTLRVGLEQAIRVLAPQGRLAVIAFHSLEDRIVKQCFRAEAAPSEPGGDARIHVVTRKPIRPSQAEVANNPASRSAKLRVIEKASRSLRTVSDQSRMG